MYFRCDGTGHYVRKPMTQSKPHIEAPGSYNSEQFSLSSGLQSTSKIVGATIGGNAC